MAYLTAGFVVRKTFLELESDCEEKEAPVIRRRASDSCIHVSLETAMELYGATAKRLSTNSDEGSASSLFGKRDSFGGNSDASTCASELEDSASSIADEQMSTSSQVATDFRTDEIRRHISSGFSDSTENEADDSEHAEGPVFCYSSGSRLHPEGCSPCKYNMKQKGCKDGADCSFCHLCPWKQPKDKRRPHDRRVAAAAKKRALKAAAEAEARNMKDGADGMAEGVMTCEPCQ